MDDLPPEILAKIFSESEDLALIGSHTCSALRRGVLWRRKKPDLGDAFFLWLSRRDKNTLRWALHHYSIPEKHARTFIFDRDDAELFALLLESERRDAEMETRSCQYLMETGHREMYEAARKAGWTADREKCAEGYVRYLLALAHSTEPAGRVQVVRKLYEYACRDPDARHLSERHPDWAKVMARKAEEFSRDEERTSVADRVKFRSYAEFISKLC